MDKQFKEVNEVLYVFGILCDFFFQMQKIYEKINEALYVMCILCPFFFLPFCYKFPKIFIYLLLKGALKNVRSKWNKWKK